MALQPSPLAQPRVPDNPDDRDNLVEGHRRLAACFPAFVSCPLNDFLLLVGAVARSWAERSAKHSDDSELWQPLFGAEHVDDLGDQEPHPADSSPRMGCRLAYHEEADSRTCASRQDRVAVASPEGHSDALCPVDAGAAGPTWQDHHDGVAANAGLSLCGGAMEAGGEDVAAGLRLQEDVRCGDTAEPAVQFGAGGGAVRGWAEEADAALDAVLEGRAAAAELEAWAAA